MFFTLYHLPVNFFPGVVAVYTFLLDPWYRYMISWVLNRSTQLKILLFWNILTVTKSQFSRLLVRGSSSFPPTRVIKGFTTKSRSDLYAQGMMFNKDFGPWGLVRGKWGWAGEVLEGSGVAHRYKYHHPRGIFVDVTSYSTCEEGS